jgi:CheY-like chemotaxis protein
MVADDEQNIRDIISELLRETGHSVSVAVDGQDAWEKIQIEPYDLYVIDVFMPRLDGLDLIAKIKELQPMAVIIIITGFSSIDVAIKAIRQGAYHYITKPIKAEELLLAVESGIKYAEEISEEAPPESTQPLERSSDHVLMRGFTPEQQQDFKLIGMIHHYPPGQLIPLDDESGSLIWIESGRINVIYNGAVVDTIQEGDIWGEETFLNSNATFTQLKSQSEVQLRRFKRKRIIEFFTYNDENLTNRYMINLFHSIYLKWRKSVHKIGLFSGFYKG